MHVRAPQVRCPESQRLRPGCQVIGTSPTVRSSCRRSAKGVELGAAATCLDQRPESAQRCHRRYWWSHYPDRHIGLVCLPYGSVDQAVQKVPPRRKDGLKGLELIVLVEYGADVAAELGRRSGRRSTRCNCHCTSTPSRRPRPEVPPVRRATRFTGVPAFQMGLIQIIAGMMARACSNAIRACACRSARAMPAGSPMNCTDGFSSSMTACAA
jgi:hypothetical protein